MRTPVFFFLYLNVVLTAAPVFDWASSGGGAKADKVRGLNVDREGNVFIAGECADEVCFGAETHKGLGLNDVFIAKLDARGKCLWSKVAGGPRVDRVYAVATDAQGNSYVTGHFQGESAEFDGYVVRGLGDYDAFVVSYDQDGKFRWVRTMGGKGYDYGHGVVTDSRGDVIVAGAVVGEATFGDVVVSNEAGAHLFVAKYHSDGTLVWVKVATGKATGSAHGVVVDGRDNIYIGGLSAGVGAFGAQVLSSPTGTSALVVKLDAAGQVLWLKQHPGEPSCLFHEIACDAQGRVWASGMFKGKAVVGADTYATTSAKDSDALLCHYDTDGKLLWSRAGQGPGIDYGLGIATDGVGNAYLTGECSETFSLGGKSLRSRGATDVYIAKFDGAGALLWLTQSGGVGSDNAYVDVMDGHGGLLIAGAYSGTPQLDHLSLTSKGSGDGYVARLDLNGSPADRRLPRDNLLVRHDAAGGVLPVADVAGWSERRGEIVRGMEAVMGNLPGAERKVPLTMKVEKEADMGSYVRRKITYQSERGSRVPAYLCVPKSALAKGAKVAAVLCLHPTDDTVGVGVVVGLGGKANRQYAAELAERGFVTLSPAYPHLADYKPNLVGLGYASGTMKAVWDNVRALDLLDSLPYVRGGSYGVIGHSLGGHNAVYTAVFDDRLKVVVSSCGLDSYLDYYDGASSVWQFGKGWCQPRYMPRLAEYAGRLAEIPFDFHEMIGALAPRRVLISASLGDANFHWQSVDKIAAAARPVYALLGAPAALQVIHPEGPHDFPDSAREQAYRLLADGLK
jgi:hypothetical protein